MKFSAVLLLSRSVFVFCFCFSFSLVVSVHVSVGLVVGRRVGQLGGRVVDARGHQLVLEVGESEAGNFSGERQVGRSGQVIEGEGAGHVDA